MAKKHPVGKFFVIGGVDGSGKTEQTGRLIARLRKEGYAVETIDFPQYGKKSAGLVEEYLNGKYGPAKEVGPYRGSIFYAADRYDASFQIRQWLSEGKIVVANRYVESNMAHQGGKIDDDGERKKYLDWLYELEYGLFRIPKPDLNVILHVTPEAAQKFVDMKKKRDYTEAKRDLHEADLGHLRAAEKVYLEIAGNYPGFTLIECSRGDKIISLDEVEELIWKKIKKLL